MLIRRIHLKCLNLKGKEIFSDIFKGMIVYGIFFSAKIESYFSNDRNNAN